MNCLSVVYSQEGKREREGREEKGRGKEKGRGGFHGQSPHWGEKPDAHTWSLVTACGNGICLLLHSSSTQPQLQEATGDMTWVCPQSQAGWLFSSSKLFLLRMSNAEGSVQKLFPHHLPLSAALWPLIRILSLSSV